MFLALCMAGVAFSALPSFLCCPRGRSSSGGELHATYTNLLSGIFAPELPSGSSPLVCSVLLSLPLIDGLRRIFAACWPL
jgi:hypothetical protein